MFKKKLAAVIRVVCNHCFISQTYRNQKFCTSCAKPLTNLTVQLAAYNHSTDHGGCYDSEGNP